MTPADSLHIMTITTNSLTNISTGLFLIFLLQVVILFVLLGRGKPISGTDTGDKI